MSNTVDAIDKLLNEAFHPSSLSIVDDSWKHAGHAGVKEHGGGHYQIHIVAVAFRGKSRIATHRMIHQALASLFPKQIHALSIHIGSAISGS